MPNMKEKILELLYEVIEEYNEQAKDDSLLDKDPEVKLFGSDSVLTSVDLVNFIVMVEDKIREKWQRDISLADEKAMSQKKSPFLSIKTLSDYLDILLNHE